MVDFRLAKQRLRLRVFGKQKLLLLALTALTLSACTGTPNGVTTISNFELDRYLGTWYEIARLDHRFERGLTDVTASYSVREDGGVAVLNRGFSTQDNEWDQVEGKAYFVEEANVGQLKVSFFGPFYGGYNIIELDQDNYQYSLVCGPNRSYLWILSRTPTLDEATLDRLVQTAAELGFATEELIYVDQSRHSSIAPERSH